MKKLFRNTAVLAFAAVAALGVTGCGATNYAKDNTTFKIGQSGPLTGPAAVYGIGVNNAAKMAIEEINAKSDYKLKGKLELLAFDDVHKAENVATGYTSMYEKGMQMSLGCVTTAPCIEFVNYAKEDKVFSLTPSASGDAVTEDNDVLYQMCYADSAQGTESGKYFNTYYKDKKVGILYQNDIDYSKGLYDSFKAAFTGTVTATQTFAANTTDFATQANALKDCDVIFLPIYYTEAALFIKQAKDIVKKELVYFGCDGLDGVDAVENFDVKEYNTGAYHQEISYLSHFDASSSDAKVKHFVETYSSKYGTDTLTQFGAAAYDCVYALYEAMVFYGKDIPVTTSAADMFTILESVFQDPNFKFSGVTGQTITWTKDGTVSKLAQRVVVNPR